MMNDHNTRSTDIENLRRHRQNRCLVVMKQQPWSCLSFVNNDEVRIDTGVEKGTTIQSWPFVAFVTLCVRVVVAFIPFVVGDVVIAVLSSIQRNDSDRSSSSD